MMNKNALTQELYKLCKQADYNTAIAALEDTRLILQMETIPELSAILYGKE